MTANRYGFTDDELVLPEAGTVLDGTDRYRVRAVLHLIAVDEADDLGAHSSVTGESVRRYARSMSAHLDGVAVAVDALLARGWTASSPDGDPDEIAVAVLAERIASADEIAADLIALDETSREVVEDDLALVFHDDLAEEDDEDAEASVPLRLAGGRLVVDEHEDEAEAWEEEGGGEDGEVLDLGGDGAGRRR